MAIRRLKVAGPGAIRRVPQPTTKISEQIKAWIEICDLLDKGNVLDDRVDAVVQATFLLLQVTQKLVDRRLDIKVDSSIVC